MAKRYDAAIKLLVEAHPADWLALARLPGATKLEVVDADISSVSPAADKVIRVAAPQPYVAHFEFQSGPDPQLDRRMLLYNVLLRWRHGLPIRSVVILLRPEANSPAVSAEFVEAGAPDAHLAFRYRLMRIWEQPPDEMLRGGLGTLPLAPISAVAPGALDAVIEQIRERLAGAASSGEVADAWTATFILLGLRYPREVGERLLKGVRNMEESTTYQAIIERGEAKGRAEEAKSLLLRLGRHRFGPPPHAIHVKLQSLSDLAAIETLAERIVDVASWEALFGSNQ